MKRSILLLTTFILLGFHLSAQQTPISNFYGFNEYLMNPAEAGVENRLQGSLSHRIQWEGIQGAPRTSFFGLHGAINEKMGIGGRLTVDKTDILQQFTGVLSYAYRVKLNESSRLSFGVSGMLLQNNIRFDEVIVDDSADDLLFGGNQEGATFDAEAGILLEWGKAKIGISSSHLFESGISYELTRTSGTFDRIRLFSGYGSYQFIINDKWNVEPSIILRTQEEGSFQYETSALLSWQNILFFGAGYRDEAGFIARAGVQFAEKFTAAYAYEFSSSGITSYSTGSHEFMIGYQLFKAQKTTSDLLPEKADLTPVKNNEKEPIKKPEQEEKVTEQKTEEAKEEKVVEEPVITETKPEKKQAQTETIPTVDYKINRELFEQKIPFEFERMNFSSGEKFRLDEIAAELNDFPEQKVLIKGHTCNMGSDQTNKEISIQRAKAVKEYLMFKGVKKEQIIIKGMVDKEPLVPNNSLENRRKNRRVEFKLMD